MDDDEIFVDSGLAAPARAAPTHAETSARILNHIADARPARRPLEQSRAVLAVIDSISSSMAAPTPEFAALLNAARTRELTRVELFLHGAVAADARPWFAEQAAAAPEAPDLHGAASIMRDWINRATARALEHEAGGGPADIAGFLAALTSR